MADRCVRRFANRPSNYGRAMLKNHQEGGEIVNTHERFLRKNGVLPSQRSSESIHIKCQLDTLKNTSFATLLLKFLTIK